MKNICNLISTLFPRFVSVWLISIILLDEKQTQRGAGRPQPRPGVREPNINLLRTKSRCLKSFYDPGAVARAEGGGVGRGGGDN